MTPALVSLYALLAAIVLSCTSRLNVGIVAIALSWAVGVYAGLAPEAVLAGFPSSLFVTLAGVTLLFSLADTNGTIGRLAYGLLGLARGQSRLVLPLIFLIACTLSTIGPGAVPSVALVAPLAMAIGARARLSPFVTALMVANGANAGNLSPLSAVGVIANTRMAAAGIGGHAWKVWAANFLAHVLVAAVAGVMLYRAAPETEAGPAAAATGRGDRFTPGHWSTIAVIAAWVGAVVILKIPLGLGAFAAAAVLIAIRAAEEGPAIQKMPWAAIVMVCGMATLVALVEKTGGMSVFTSIVAALARPATVNGVIAFVTGVISSYSSTSGVVLPTFLAMAPGLVREVGGGDPLAVALSINVGSSLVDVSPLSTLGALCVAAIADPRASRDLFRQLLIWGLSMTIVGALLCQLFANAFARW